jgi:hypothetical protein
MAVMIFDCMVTWVAVGVGAEVSLADGVRVGSTVAGAVVGTPPGADSVPDGLVLVGLTFVLQAAKINTRPASKIVVISFFLINDLPRVFHDLFA